MKTCVWALSASLLIAPAAAAPKQDDPKPGAAFRDCTNCPEMIVIPAGRFAMGSPASEPLHEANESPLHEVVISKPFAVGRTEITLAEYQRFVAASGHRQAKGCLTAEKDDTAYRDTRDYLEPGIAQDDSHPVVCVSWDDAIAYAAWLSRHSGQRYRLLTEAEWEYAARGGTQTPFHWGSKVTTAHANYDGQYKYDAGDAGERRLTTLPVGSFPANPFGLRDMAGNVWEWVQDCTHKHYNGAPSDGSAWLEADGGDCSDRIRRSGAWEGYATSVRSANRYWNRVDFRSNYDGFRVARDL